MPLHVADLLSRGEITHKDRERRGRREREREERKKERKRKFYNNNKIEEVTIIESSAGRKKFIKNERVH